MSDGMDDQLREALQRREPSEDFSRRVMERIEREASAKLVEMPLRTATRPLWWNAAAVAACLIMLTAGLFERQREIRSRERNEAVQVLAALQLTAGKLHAVRTRLVNTGFVRRSVRGEAVR